MKIRRILIVIVVMGVVGVVVLGKNLSAAEATPALMDSQGYDFVSEKLLQNKTNAEQAKPQPRGCMGTLVRETAFLVPSVFLGYITAALIGAALAQDNKGWGALLGAVFGGPGTSVSYYVIAKFIASSWHEKPIALPTLQEFIKNWSVYKNNVPVEFHEEFDGLYRNYLRNQGKIVMKESQALEILNRVLDLCVQQVEIIQYKNHVAMSR